MRKLFAVPGAIAAAALIAAACGGNTPAASVPAVPTGVLPSIPVPSIALPDASFSIPSFGSFAPDTELESKFPTTIDGKPVTDVSSANFAQFFMALGSDDPDSQLPQLMGILQSNGINPATMSVANGEVEIDDTTETISAFRTPGASASTLLSLFPQLTALGEDEDSPPVIGTATVGGKSVMTLDDGSGYIDYLYPSGEILWDVNTDNADNAGTIMAALQ
jgi:hypothetical protein